MEAKPLQTATRVIHRQILPAQQVQATTQYPDPANQTRSASFKVYQNYDLPPVKKILFEDNFLDDADGEFAAHWELQKGQAVVNKMGDRSALLITEGNYGWVTPLMKQKNTWGNEWTVEFDTRRNNEAYGIIVFLQDQGHNDLGKVMINNNEATIQYTQPMDPNQNHWMVPILKICKEIIFSINGIISRSHTKQTDKVICRPGQGCGSSQQ